jgi:Na+/H+ antiporter NhaC
MLIVLCIIFPPAIPFVLLYYMLGNRSASRAAVEAQNRTTRTVAAAHREASLIQFAAMTPDQQQKVTEALQEARKRAAIQWMIKWVFILGTTALFIGWLNGWHAPG